MVRQRWAVRERRAVIDAVKEGLVQIGVVEWIVGEMLLEGVSIALCDYFKELLRGIYDKRSATGASGEIGLAVIDVHRFE